MTATDSLRSTPLSARLTAGLLPVLAFAAMGLFALLFAHLRWSAASKLLSAKGGAAASLPKLSGGAVASAAAASASAIPVTPPSTPPVRIAAMRIAAHAPRH